MSKEMKTCIEHAEIPEILRDYFLRNYHVHPYLNEHLLSEVEESYIEYDSLYEFDDAEFSSYVITGVKKQDKHEYFYHYLKKVLDNNLTLFSKSPISNKQRLTNIRSNISRLPEDKILINIKNLLISLQGFRNTKDLGLLLHAYQLAGRLQILFTLYPDNNYKKDFECIFTDLINIKL